MPAPSLAYDVCALGNAIVDIVADVDEAFLRQQRIIKDTMILVDGARITQLRKSLKAARVVCAGGAAGNTVAGLASFGGRAAFMGKIATDDVGHLFKADLQKLGVHYATPPLAHATLATGLCLSFITPDAHRSMCTSLGAAIEFGLNDVHTDIVQAAQILYLEGYLLDRAHSRLALKLAAESARAAKRKTALALCDRFCVERNRKEFVELVEGHTDILFANEKELMALFQAPDLETALADATSRVPLAVVTRSERGAVIAEPGGRFEAPAEPVGHAVDRTGAGDLYAAGFLFGLARQRDLKTCAHLGAIAAAEVIGHYGSRPEHSLTALAKQKGVAG
ncbi:MAG TPA: adenosine kinase [Alphaproteobacteria bacterium]|nr:adenosine kinase [Alphaproteobacteria bacterium]